MPADGVAGCDFPLVRCDRELMLALGLVLFINARDSAFD